MRHLLTRSLSDEGYHVTGCKSAMDLRDRVRTSQREQRSESFDLIVVGTRLPDLTGLELVESLKGCVGVPPIILIAAFSDEEVRARANRAGAVEVFENRFEIADLLGTIRQIIRVQDTLQRIQRSRTRR